MKATKLANYYLPEAKAIDILGLKVMPFTQTTLNETILRIIRQGGHAIIPNVNVHFANLAYHKPWLHDFFNQAPANFCDGQGIVLAARILGQHLPARITYADWLWSLCSFAARHDLSFFFLGGEPGRAEKSAAILQKNFPGLRILNAQHGHFNKTPAHEENEAMIARINDCRPDILLVGFGMPLQEQWLLKNWPRIDARIALTGGGIFDFISGQLKRAPAWMRHHGLEWFGRFLLEPRRLWRRYFIGNPLFLWRVLKQKWAPKLRLPAGSDGD
ncbi:MAG: WecB/TagA/CpsF family glycosyltransferase [Candidatus Aminicenantes bacterium]|nr:WecB/TagA/CpsF family glycosyltransferase [Candidatus Aminicenantes bacterium]